MPLIRVSDPVLERLKAMQAEMVAARKREVSMAEVMEVLLEKVTAP